MSEPQTHAAATLVGNRCCGRKPIEYKRVTPMYFCWKCCREYDHETRKQVANFAWQDNGDGTFTRKGGQS